MSSHEPDLPADHKKSMDDILQEIAEDVDENEPIDLPLEQAGSGLRIRPDPEAFARSIESYRYLPDWSPEKLEFVLQLLRKTLAPSFDVEAAVNLYRSMAEPTLPKNKQA